MNSIFYQMKSSEVDSSTWEADIPPKKSIFLDFSPEATLKITSISFGSVDSDEPSNVIANINSLLVPDDNSKDEKCDVSKNNVIALGTLTPKDTEKIEVYFQFSPLDIIEVSNSGSNEVHLSGCLEPIDSEFEGLDEEEEEEEEKGEEQQQEEKGEEPKEEKDEENIEETINDPDTIQSRFSEMAANQPEKPQKKIKKNKNKNKDDDDGDNDDNANEE